MPCRFRRNFFNIQDGWSLRAAKEFGTGSSNRAPDAPITGIVTSGRKQYFQAIYPDRAVSSACIGCHNSHPLSPKRDFKLNDVMGGIAITIPLE